MIVDCDGCAVRGPACSDCVVSVLLGMPAARRDEPAGPWPADDLDEAERAAIAVLAGSGLVPPLRLVPVGPPAADGPPAGGSYDARRGRATRAG